MLGSNNTVSVKRKTTVNGKKTYPASNILEGLPCYIERASAEIASSFGEVPSFKNYLIVFEDMVDVKIGDQVTDGQNNIYIVGGEQKFQNNDDVPNHTENLMTLEYHKD